MNIQLFPSNYQGNTIDVVCNDANATCQYLIDYAQNQLQTYIQLGFAKQTGESGFVDPQWPLLPLYQEGTQFYVIMPNQDGNAQQTGNAGGNGEVTLNIYVNDQQVTSIQATIQQQLQEIIMYVNQNMNTQYNTAELYDSTGTGLSNNPAEYIGQFAQAQAPFLLFIPGCQSGISNFVQVMPPQPQVNIPPQQNVGGFQMGGVQAPSPLAQGQQKQQSQTSESRIAEAKDSFKVQKNFSLFIDQQGEFVIYKFHHPVMFSGTLKKSTSKPKKNFLESNYDFVPVSKIRFAETDDYSFAVKWDNGNISTVKITQQ